MVITSPFTYAEKSDIRYAARLASSWCSPTRFKGMRSAGSNFLTRSPGSSLLHAPSVGNGPGAMALLRILYFAHSTARDRVNASTPAFPHAEGTTYPEPVHA